MQYNHKKNLEALNTVLGEVMNNTKAEFSKSGKDIFNVTELEDATAKVLNESTLSRDTLCRAFAVELIRAFENDINQRESKGGSVDVAVNINPETVDKYVPEATELVDKELDHIYDRITGDLNLIIEYPELSDNQVAEVMASMLLKHCTTPKAPMCPVVPKAFFRAMALNWIKSRK